ncbi:MAG: hypothetical protein MUF38_01010 [Anaerolineae bacterium]|jgi:hypothetical protein|nr:hypothetical protein [Anaerolineae bacterium]
MLTDRDYDLISDYLDGALTDAQRATVESRLANDPEFAAELEGIRRTVALVKGLPELVAPRDFTLSRQQALDIDRELGRTPLAAPPRPRLLPRRFLPLVSAAASTMLVLVGALALLTGPARTPSPSPASAIAMVAEDALTLTKQGDEQATESQMTEESALAEIEQSTTETAFEESEAPAVMMVRPEGTPTLAATQDMALRTMPQPTPTAQMTTAAQAGVPSTAPPPIAPSPLPQTDVPGGMGGGAMDSIPSQPPSERPTDIAMDDSGAEMTFSVEPLTAVGDEPPADAAESAAGDLFSSRMADETVNAADAPSDAVLAPPAPNEGISPLVALGMMAAGFVLGALTLWGWRRQR